MNLLLCDKCARRNIMCFNCVDHKYYMESNFSHDEYIKKIAVKEFATKIIELLEDTKTKCFVTGITANPYEFGACYAMDKAIEIIKEEM